MNLKISDKIRKKLNTKHSVSEEEILECFANREGVFLSDTREEHLTDPISQWFVAETDKGRLLKIVFIFRGKEGVEIKTAYNPSERVVELYEQINSSS